MTITHNHDQMLSSAGNNIRNVIIRISLGLFYACFSMSSHQATRIVKKKVQNLCAHHHPDSEMSAAQKNLFKSALETETGGHTSSIVENGSRRQVSREHVECPRYQPSYAGTHTGLVVEDIGQTPHVGVRTRSSTCPTKYPHAKLYYPGSQSPPPPGRRGKKWNTPNSSAMGS